MKHCTSNSVLVVDDEPGLRVALKTNFQRDGWHVQTASGAKEALSILRDAAFPLVVTDIRMPDGDGLHLMRTLHSSHPSTAVVLLTAYGSVPEAVRAIQDGACDYLTKPVSFDQLRLTVERVMNRPYVKACAQESQNHEIVGYSPLLLKALERAQHAARTSADILIEAESGTGKELLARFVYQNSSRNNAPFVAINCAAVPDALLESELFGHVKGAFTGAATAKPGKLELAKHGTLLLDEIGDMPIALQPKLLRVLQERQFEPLGGTQVKPLNARVIATTNVHLMTRVAQGEFRADLYYRLNVIPLTLPTLRERLEDIPLLAEYFAKQFAREAQRPVPRLEDNFVAALQQHRWPGNVREFANLMRRIVTLNESGTLTPADLRDEVELSRERYIPVGDSARSISAISMRELERQALSNTLHATGGNRTRAAEMLGMSVRTVRNKIREYGLPPRRYS